MFTAPLGPPSFLALSLRPGQSGATAQFWVASVDSPGFRWELWEEEAKAWAARNQGLPPAPPDLVAVPHIEQLALVQDAVQLAQAESPGPARDAVTALLRSEALLADLPAREPLFPYFERRDLNPRAFGSRPKQKILGMHMYELSDAQPLRFSVEGPCMLRIEARGRFAANASHREVPLDVQLSSGDRLLALAAEEVAPGDPSDTGPVSTPRRLLVSAAPGKHVYKLQVRGGPAWVSVMMHYRSIHAEDLASRSENIPWLLRRVRGAHGVLATLLEAETSFLQLQNEDARQQFERVLELSRSPRLQAFALLRLAALSFGSAEEAPLTARALALLGDAKDDATDRLRSVITAEHLSRVVASSSPRTVAKAESVALLLRTPGAVPHMLGAVGPLLRQVAGARSLSLPLLAGALSAAPLDASRLRQLAHEWFIGTRWAAMPMTEQGGAQRADLLVPQRDAGTCAQAVAQGVHAYGLLPEASALVVPDNLAPPHSLRRFHLVALRSGKPPLGWAELTLDGRHSRLPLVLPAESIPIALSAGRHTARAQVDAAGSVLVPCALVERPTDQEPSSEGPLLVEQHFSELKGSGAQVHVMLLSPGTPGFLGLELRPSPELRAGRLLLRTDQGVLGTVEVHGHGRDDKVVARLPAGLPVTITLPVPAATRALQIIRQDDGAPLLVRALLRRSLAPSPKNLPRWPGIDSDPALLERLRHATRALRRASGAVAQAEARLHRAEILIGLNALQLARLDLELALPVLTDDSSQERARALLASTMELPLIPQLPEAAAELPGALVLAAGKDLPVTEVQSECLNAALTHFVAAPSQGRAAAVRCGGQLGLYVAARLEEYGGNVERAAQHYGAAYLQSVAAGSLRPALARDAALRFAERGPGPGSALAVALATAAAQEQDPDGDRAVERVRGLAYAEPVRDLDGGTAVRWAEPVAVPQSLRAALADEPWTPGLFMEARPGQTAETEFTIEHPVRVRVETLCDVRGGLRGEGPPCELAVEVDGNPVTDQLSRMLEPGERAEVAVVSFDKGAHRIQVALLQKGGPGVAFVHLSTSRPLAGSPAGTDAAGYYAMPIVPPPVRRFLGNKEQPVQLRVQGPTVLRIDALVDVESGSSARGLAVELAQSGSRTVEHTYPVCSKAEEHQPAVKIQSYECRSAVRVPLLGEGTYQINLRPVGTPRMALALAVYEDVPAGPGGEGGLLQSFPTKPIPLAAHPELQALPVPNSNLVRGLGTLQVQQLISYSNHGASYPQSNLSIDSQPNDQPTSLQNLPINTPPSPSPSAPATKPPVGDTYAETSMTYHRKLDNLPIWLQAGALVRLRDGSPSYGGSGIVFARVPLIQLRIFAEGSAITQAIANNQEFALELHSYVERSFPVGRHFFVLPRFSFNAHYLSLSQLPTPTLVDGTYQNVTPVDNDVFNIYNRRHPTGVYGQLLLWWVPFINMISYAQVRVISNQSVRQLDAVSARAGFDLAIRTSELSAYYDFNNSFIDDARLQELRLHHLAGQLQQTIWVHRNHRLGLWLWGSVEVVSGDSTVQAGLFWEGSHGRGLDDYSTPVINLPQQLGRGRGFVKPEETLR